MSKYKNIHELSVAFKNGELKNWVLMIDNDNTYLSYIGPCPSGIDAEDFEEQKNDEGEQLWDSPDVYILDQALSAAGIPNKEV